VQIKESFPLKGARQYVQGASIFNAFVRAAKTMGHAQGSIDISFKKIVSNPDCLIQARVSQPEDACVALVVGLDGSKTTFCLVSAGLQGQVSRVEYDERAVCSGASIDGCSISVRNAAHQDQIELLIALCKKLHQAYFPIDKKWLFSRYKGRFPLELSGDVKIAIAKNIGSKLTCSDVFSSGTKVGEIFFS
jgi:hypothetical protein